MKNLSLEKYMAKLDKAISRYERIRSGGYGEPFSRQRKAALSFDKKNGQRIARTFRKISYAANDRFWGI